MADSALITDAAERALWKHGLPKCTHQHAIIVAVVTPSGKQGRRWQCQGCGKVAVVVPLEQAREAPAVDQRRADEWAEAERKAKQASGERARQLHAMREEYKPLESAEWWAQYAAYLASPEWKACRRRVLERDQWRCTAVLPGCTGQAEQVHHREGGMSYAYLDKLGQTPLFLLASVCVHCHQLLTAADRRISGRNSRPPDPA